MIIKKDMKDWEKFCIGLNEDIEKLCNHNITKNDLYESIKG